jgi:FAD/FMN-containing dehydrogenase
MPAHTDFLSFVFAGAAPAAAAVSEIGRAELAEEVYVFDPESTRKNMADVDLGKALRTLAGVARGQGGWLRGLRESARLIAAGRHFVPEDAYSLHLVCAGRDRASVEADLAACREIARHCEGVEVPNSIPKAVRGSLFPPLNDVVDADGKRWAALNAKVAHSDVQEFIVAVETLLAQYAERMRQHEVTVSRLMMAVSNHSFSYEPVLHWRDEWLPVHKRVPEPGYLAKLAEPAPNPGARALVHEIRGRLVELFAERGAASNQIGKTYRYASVLHPESEQFLRRVRDAVDPAHAMNPGALELR